MGNNKILYVVIVLLLAVIVGGGTYFFLNKEGATTTDTGGPPPVANQTPPASETLSEQPNKAKYDEYLSDIYLGKMAIGKTIGTDGFPTATNIFTKGVDLFCTMMTLKKTVPSGETAVAVYDTFTKQDNQPKMVFPMELKAGGSGGCQDLTQPPGKYEYKLYFDDFLVAVLPFEVKSEITNEEKLVITIKDFSFIPSTLTVKIGTKVTWTNQDSANHTVTSEGGNELSSGFLAQGGSYSHTFNKAGTFNYHCTLHPLMKGQIIVTE